MDTPDLLWTPSAERNRTSNFLRYLGWLEQHRGLRFGGYDDAWEWSSTHIEEFWASLWDFFDIAATRPYRAVLDTRRMPGARWFDGAELNYAEHAFRHARGAEPALWVQSELTPLMPVSWDELRARVAALADALRELGVVRGDRVAALLPNGAEAVVALLACASLGAIWSSCPPEYGARGISERLRQIEPKVLIAADGYAYGGRRIDRRDTIDRVRAALPALTHTVLVPHLDPDAHMDGTLRWPDLLLRDVALRFEPLPFDHPLWILYSSGTTGAPKAIVHGHGGILLEHLKALVIQNDLKPGDCFFWHATTGWMMWNVLVSGLLAGCSIVLYDGSPAWPDLDVLWQLTEDTAVTRFGAGAAFFIACMKAGLEPGRRHRLDTLRTIGSTGSPLPPAAFRWVYDAAKRDVWLASSSGGTDVATAFVGGCPLRPVHAGELQGPALGVRVAAFDNSGQSVVGEVGELVVCEPLPSMPLFLWHDDNGSRYRASWFATFPGVWRHGDRVHFTNRGTAVIHGRSDATLNRHGVRFGTAEIYAALETLPDVADSLVVGVEQPDGGYYMPLFVALHGAATLDDTLRAAIRARIREAASPRHVPDDIVQVAAVPRTLNGKRLEVPVKRILQGERPEDVVDAATLADRAALQFFVDLARARRAEPGRRPGSSLAEEG